MTRKIRAPNAKDSKDSETAMEIGTLQRPKITVQRSTARRGRESSRRLSGGRASSRSVEDWSTMSVFFKAASMKLSHQIKSDKQTGWFIRGRVSNECGASSSSLGYNRSWIIRETQGEGMAPDPFLNAESVCWTMNTKLASIDEGGNDVSDEGNSRPNIEGATNAE